MVASEKSQRKLYYRIGEVAELVGVEAHVLRYWERQFSAIRPQKSRNGRRLYSWRDLERLVLLKDLLHVQGFTIAGARRHLRGKGAAIPLLPSTPAAGDDSSRPVPRPAAMPPPRVEAASALEEIRREVCALLAELPG